MKSLFELRRSKKYTQYIPKKEPASDYYRQVAEERGKKEHEEALNKEKELCRVLPHIVTLNYERFFELAPISKVHNIEHEAHRVRAAILIKN